MPRLINVRKKKKFFYQFKYILYFLFENKKKYYIKIQIGLHNLKLLN